MSRRSGPRLALAVALGASLLANAFLLGFAVRNTGQGPFAGFQAESIGRSYPDQVRAEFRNLLRENRPRALAALRELREARRNLAAAANAATFDEAEVERIMQDVRTATEALQRLMQEFLLEALRRTHGAS
ncbi:periplasmic heavy metal sensor [Lutibaculum baratangense]|uniref:Periplasmic heavy metal sensor n=1 Tax=Lutibaculum baratangense AMV1 TaxID=631454 RepID=V4QUR9_9HYPH|nr:periplasmic heavy metal sensor [Lutibaculum baratangense]ESR23482.1 hypothetical protein N177_3550 [Lutibaculum baratangense AMV1]